MLEDRCLKAQERHPAPSVMRENKTRPKIPPHTHQADSQKTQEITCVGEPRTTRALARCWQESELVWKRTLSLSNTKFRITRPLLIPTLRISLKQRLTRDMPAAVFREPTGTENLMSTTAQWIINQTRSDKQNVVVHAVDSHLALKTMLRGWGI